MAARRRADTQRGTTTGRTTPRTSASSSEWRGLPPNSAILGNAPVGSRAGGVAEFRAIKMQPSLERARRHKGLLTA